MKNLSNYKNFLFDCDGVILNSNKIKTYAFGKSVYPWGGTEAEKLMIKYHVQNGGVKRQLKFKHFIENIWPSLGFPRSKSDGSEPNIENLTNTYANIINKEMFSCQVASNLDVIKKRFSQSCWFVVSGGSEAEIINYFNSFGILQLFDGGINGNPRTKYDILKNLIYSGLDVKDSLFIGDSKYDHEVASAFEIDFVFIYGWTEMPEWEVYCSENNILKYESLGLLFNSK